MKWYFTFGIGHLLHDYVIVINDSYIGAREKMIEQFEYRWCEQYDEETGKRLVEEYGYIIIEV